MNLLKNIVVGVDFSDRARCAVVEAARIAKWNGSKLHLVHVVEQEATEELAAHEGRRADEMRVELVGGAKKLLQEWSEGFDLPDKVSHRAVYGHPVEELVKQIKQVNADLFVAGVRGTVNEARGAGSQATRLVRRAPCKVLLVGEGSDQPFKRAVACVDFSPTSRIAVEQALHLAALDGCEVCFLHVYAAPWRKFHYRSEAGYSTAFKESYLKDLDRNLREFVGATGDAKVSFHLQHGENKGHGICEFVGGAGADLVVIGTRGRTSLKYLVLGSTAEHLLREQSCSVLAVRPPKD